MTVYALSFATGLKDERSIEFRAYAILKDMAAYTKGDQSKCHTVHTAYSHCIRRLDTSPCRAT